MESSGASRDSWLVQGDMYAGREGLFDHPDTHVDGGNVMGRWARRFSPSSQFRSQVYFDHTYRRVFDQINAVRNTVELDLQQQIVAGRQELVFGADFRSSRGDEAGNAAFHFDPQVQTDNVAGVFAQDEIAVAPKRLALIAGVKFERNTFTGIEPQPSVRLRWTPSARQTVWGAVSRAVRLPARFDTDLRFTNPASGTVTLTGSDDFDTEKVTAYETGYRAELARYASVDLAAHTQRLRRPAERGVPDQRRPAGAAGEPDERARPGAPMSRQRCCRWPSGGCTRRIPTCTRPSPSIPGRMTRPGGSTSTNDPSHIFKLRSSVDLPHRIELDALLRRIDGAAPPGRSGLRGARRADRLARVAGPGGVAGRPEPAARAPPGIPALEPDARGIPAGRVRPIPVAILTGIRFRACAAALLSVWAWGQAPARAEQRTATAEDDIKATFLYNFTKFVEWPAAARLETFTICTVAEPAFNAAVDRTVVR